MTTSIVLQGQYLGKYVDCWLFGVLAVDGRDWTACSGGWLTRETYLWTSIPARWWSLQELMYCT